MLFVQICTVILLSRLFATTWGAVNLALNKPATQSSEYTTSYPAGNAVNGILDDFSHTADGRDVSWWRVNLGAKYSIGSIKVYNREDVSTRLRRTRILTSYATSPTTPSLTSNDWTEVMYQGPPYPGGATTHSFNPPIDGQYVAVYYEEPTGLSLKEVEIFDYNYALSQSTDSSSNQGNSPRAVDGALSTVFSTKNELSPWWKVGLGEAILLREVLVFVNAGNCNPGPVNCASRLTNVYFLTHPSNTVAEPDTAGNNGWNKCYYSEQARGEYYTVQCNQGSQYPLTRHFGIRSTAVTRVELRQVEIYGFELPQLSADIDGKADTTTSTSITVSSRPWNQLMTGGFPPTGYTFQLSGGQSKTVPHNSGSPRFSTTFNGLDAGQAYTFTVSCTIQEIACTGPTYSFTASTSCAVPDVPRDITLSPVKVQHSGRQKWKYTATWMAPSKANCAGPLQYQYNLIGESTSALQTTTTATFYLDGDVPFDFIVKAKNSVGFSTPKSTSERSGVLKPQFSSGQITITANSAYCVTVTWSVPQYPGGTISQYQCRCGSESWMDAGGDGTKQSCNHLPYTQITCWVRAKNSAGWGNTQSTGITDCAEPDIPGEITLTAVKTQHSSRQRWKYTASWSASSKVYCADAVQYQYNLAGQPTALQTTTTTIFYVDGDVLFELIVKAKNSVGFSTSRSKSERAGVLNPQFSSGQITVRANSAYCVTVTWSVPQYPGGTISQYQYRCGSEGWMGAGGDRTKDSCGHQPNTQVTCWVRAENSAGWGTTQSSRITDCAVPTVPQTLSLPTTTTQNNGRIIWEYSARWQAPIRSNCNDTIQYQYGIQGALTSTLQSGRTAMFYLDGDQLFDFIVKAKNSVGLSVSLSQSGRSDPLAPQFGTDHISLMGTSSECVKLSWTEPQYPGGAITQYQYRCNEDTFTNLGLQITNKLSCGYEPYTEVTCRFRAGNIAGFSDVQTKVAITHCIAPLFTQAPSATEGYDSGRERRQVVVNVQGVKEHCATLDPIQYKVLDREFSTDNTIRQLNATTNYNITVKATNNLRLSTSVYIIVMTGELEPWDGPQITDKYSEYKTCAVVEWKEPSQPNGVITEYQYKCARQDQNYETGWTTTTTTSLSDCGYDAGNLVKCRVKAATAIGYGPAVNVILNITCANPSAPLFSLSSNRNSDRSATIEIYLLESKHKCTYLKPYAITITDLEEKLLYSTTDATAGNHTIDNAAPFTNYTVTIEAINDDNQKSTTSEIIFTVETAPSDGPKLDVTFTDSCVLLNIQPPEYPNGIISLYQYWCAEVGIDYKGSLPITAPEINAGYVPQVCDFPQATEVVCDVYAVNGAGESPTSSITGYTKAAITSSQIIKLLSPKETNSQLVVIQMHPVDLEDPALKISSYLVLLMNRTSTIVKRSTDEKCDVDKENCITIAKIDSELVTADGYRFYIGDEKSYGGHVNSALVPKSSYSLQIAIYVQLPEDGMLIIQVLSEELTFTAPSINCQSSPTIKNAIASTTRDEAIGEKVLYACEYGYQRVSGEYQLTCSLNDEYETEWTGKPIVCTKGLSIGLGVGIGSAIVVMGLIGAVVFLKLRDRPSDNHGQSPEVSNELAEYAELSVPKPSNYTELSFDQTRQHSQIVDPEYDIVAEGPKTDDVYEAIHPNEMREASVSTIKDK